MRFLKIIDLANIGRAHLAPRALDVVKALMGDGLKFFPETLGDALIVNAPYVFGMAWSVISRWLPPETLAKVRVYGTDGSLQSGASPHTTLASALSAQCGPGRVPSFLMGDCTCGGADGCCPAFDPNLGLTAVSVAAGTVLTFFFFLTLIFN